MISLTVNASIPQSILKGLHSFTTTVYLNFFLERLSSKSCVLFREIYVSKKNSRLSGTIKADRIPYIMCELL